MLSAIRLDSITVPVSEVVDPVFFLVKPFPRQFGKIAAQIEIVVIIAVCVMSIVTAGKMLGNKPLVSTIKSFRLIQQSAGCLPSMTGEWWKKIRLAIIAAAHDNQAVIDGRQQITVDMAEQIKICKGKF